MMLRSNDGVEKAEKHESKQGPKTIATPRRDTADSSGIQAACQASRSGTVTRERNLVEPSSKSSWSANPFASLLLRK